MFDKLKKTFGAKVEQVREIRSNTGPPSLASLPAGTASVGGLGAVPVDLVSAYVGMEVREVRPLDRLGPESSSIIGDKIRSRMREAGVGDPSLAPGELVAGQNAARIERLRAQGVPEDQIALIQGKIAEVTAAHQQSGWTIEFVNGNRASVQLFDAPSSDSGFAGLQSRYEYQHTKAGAHSMQNNLTEFAVHRIDDAPYEAYYLPGHLSARGRAHEAKASASHLDTLQLEETLAALAILALHSLEG
ncbi:MAG: hypothetical protein ABI658_09495 [Acidimicrobiales bacterium]